MMRSVLADMALEVEGAIALVMRLCRASISPPAMTARRALARLLTPAVKYWVCKTAPAFVYEAMECLGGNGYVEESAPAAALSRGAGECDLGRLGQCHVPRRAARACAPKARARRRCCASLRTKRRTCPAPAKPWH